MNTIINFKNRIIDQNKKVKIYRNLNKKGIWYSILQNNKVVGHTEKINLENCKFHVGISTRDRIRQTGKKEVHAYISGQIVESINQTDVKVFYNPKLVDGFTRIDNKEIITRADGVILDEKGVRVLL